MRKPSPIRVWNWLAAAGLLFCLASFAAAQKAPKVGKDPASGHSLTAAQAAGPELHQVGEDEGFLQKRHEWFYGQRAYPLGFIPPNARLNALKEMDAMIEEEIKSGLRPPKGAVAPQQQGSVEPRIGFPFSSTGTSIGPTPENNTFGNAFFGTPTDSGRVAAIAVDPSDVTGKTVYMGGANGGIWKSTDSGAHWTPVTDTQPTLAIGSIAIAPSNASIIYVGTGELPFVGINPTTGGENYYGAGVLKSIDAGANWTQLTGPFVGPLSNLVGGARIPAIAVHPTNPSIVLAGIVMTSSGGADAGIYRTADGGTTWTHVVSGAVGTGVVFDPTNGDIVYASLGRGGGNANNGVYKSIDAGVSFAKLAGGLPTVNVGRIELAIAASSPTTVYASIADSSTSSGNLLGLFKTTNGGTTWTQLQSGSGPGAFDYCGGQCFYSHAIAVSPVNPNFVIAGGTAGFGAGIPTFGQTVFRSTDGGMTFTDIHIGSSGVRVHADQHAFRFSGDGSVLYDGNDGGVWRTDNPTAAPGTLDWVNLNGTATLAEFYPGFAVDENNANRAVGGTQDNGTIAFSGNALWDQIACGDGAANLIDRKVPSTVYVMCTSGNSPYIQRSLTGGGVGTFTRIETGISTSDRREFIPFITMDHSSTNILYTPTFRVYRSMDWGTTWTAISPDLTADGVSSIAVVAVADSNSNVVYAATDDARVWRTTNALSASPTWTNLNTTDLPNRFFTSIGVDGSNPDIAYLGASGFKFGGDTKGHVFKTINGGVSWTDISGNLPNTPVNAIVVDNTAGTLFVGTDIGVFTTTNGGTTWTTFATGLPRVAVLSLAGTGAVGFAATHGRGVFAVDTFGSIPAGPVLASISPSFKAAASGSFTLTADGANFLNPTSKVEWDHSQTGVTTAFVSGNQLTATIDNSLLTPGVHDVTVFDAGQVPNESQRLRFAVTGTAPSLTSISPTFAATGGPAFTLTANGSGFSCGGATPTLVDFGGDLLTPSTCTATSMQVTVPAGDIATGRSVPVRAFTTPPGGGPSGALTFTVAGPPPSNDDFNNAITASPTPFTDTKDTTGATTDTGGRIDPTPSCATSSRFHTIWYKFTPTSNVTINADTSGSNYDTVLDVVTGSPGSFTEIVCNDDVIPGFDLTSKVSFAATANTTYFFMVAGFDNTQSGTAVFHLSTATPPANDNFAAAITASPTPFMDTKDTTGATTQVGEPVPNAVTCTNGEDTTNTHSIWYYFIAPSNGTINADTHGSTASGGGQLDTILQAVTGSALGAFTPVACNDDTNFPVDFTSQVSFAATSGVRYTFMVSGFDATQFGTAVFHLTFTSSGGGPDLSVVKTHTGNFTVGTNGVYTITVSNIGTSPTTGAITVTDTLPTGLGFVSGTGTGWTCSAVAQVVTCTNAGPIANGANSVITLTVTVGAAAVPSVTNTATVATAGDSNAANNTANDPTTVTAAPAPDLMMAKSHTGNFLVGVNGTYTLTVTNVGTAATTGTITVTDTLPTGLGFVSGTGTGWTCGAVAQLVTCTNPGPIAISGTSTIALVVSVGASAAATVTNTATVSTAGDSNANNNSASDPTTVNRIDLSITKTHTGNFFVGVNNTYTLTVTNVGTAATTGTITVTDTLPTGLGFVSGTGTGWTCSAVAQVVTCTNPGPLAPSAVSPITLTVSVGAAAAPSVTNTATVATTNDSNAANDSSSNPTTVLNPDLSILKSHTGSFVAGTNGNYTLTVTNVGTTATGGTITVTDTLPTGLTFVSGTGTGWTCGAAGQAVTCTNPGPLAPTASSAVTLVVPVGTAALPSVTNTATVSTPGDTNAANNSSSDITAVTAPDLSLTKTHAGNFTVGVNGTYTLTVTNGGNAATTATITVTDTLPANLGFVSGTGTGWTCSAVALVVTCTNPGPLAPAGVSIITLTVSTVSAGTVTNNASVLTAGDSNAANNSASDPTTINNPAPTLTGINPNVGNVGQTISMTLTGTGFNSQSVVKFGTTSNTGGTVSNGGTTLTISIPGTELTAVGIVSVTVFNPTPGGGTSAGQNFTISDFTVSSPTGEQTVAAGGSATFTITVATQGGALANDVTFSVTGLPGASTGAFNPTSFARGTNGGNTTLTIATTKRGAMPPLRSPRPPRPNPLLWLLAAVLAMMSYTLLRRGLRTRRLALYLPLALLLLSAAFVAGCAGPAGTPVGTSTLTVTATSGGVAHSTQVMIMVQ